MRVLIDYRPALRERSGVGEFVFQLARLSRRIARHRGIEAQLTLFSSSWKDRLERDAELHGAAIVDRRVPVSVLNLLWHRLEWPPVEMLSGSAFDVVHSPHPLLLPSRSAARVVTIHDLYFLTHPERSRAEVRRDYPALARAHAQRADQIIVPSQFTALDVERQLGVPAERVSVCPHGRPAWAPRTTAPADGYVLFFGTLEPRKNVAGLLDAYQRLIERADLRHGRTEGSEPADKAAACRNRPRGHALTIRAWLERIEVALRAQPSPGICGAVSPPQPTQARACSCNFLRGGSAPALEAMTMECRSGGQPRALPESRRAGSRRSGIRRHRVRDRSDAE